MVNRTKKPIFAGQQYYVNADGRINWIPMLHPHHQWWFFEFVHRVGVIVSKGMAVKARTMKEAEALFKKNTGLIHRNPVLMVDWEPKCRNCASGCQNTDEICTGIPHIIKEERK